MADYLRIRLVVHYEKDMCRRNQVLLLRISSSVSAFILYLVLDAVEADGKNETFLPWVSITPNYSSSESACYERS